MSQYQLRHTNNYNIVDMDHTSTSSQEIADDRNSDSSTDSGNKSSRRHTRELWWTRRPLKNFWPLSLLWLDDLDDDARRQLLCHSGLRVGDDKLWQLAKRGGSQDGAQYEASEDTPWHIPRFLNPWQDVFLGFTNLTDGELRLCCTFALPPGFSPTHFWNITSTYICTYRESLASSLTL